ncbi:MAG: hypothetical protein Q8L48_22920 [Archangium sp.]|nr:hypothetical protein [Archangium sp.]
MSLLVALVLQPLFAAAPPPELPRLLVQEFTVRGVDAALAEAITDGIGAEVDHRGYFRSLTSKDVQTILGVERQKQLLGCSPEASTCLTELAGALGAPYVLSGTLSRIGPSLQLSMQMLDVSKSMVVARSIRIARDVDTLRQLLPWALAEATATPAPPRPSKVPGLAFIGAGSAAAAVGLALGAQALIQEQQYQHDLATGQRTPGLLERPSFYQQKGDELALQKSLGLAAICAGAAAIGVGIYLLPSGPGSGEVSVAMQWTGSGVAFTGSFR